MSDVILSLVSISETLGNLDHEVVVCGYETLIDAYCLLHEQIMVLAKSLGYPSRQLAESSTGKTMAPLTGFHDLAPASRVKSEASDKPDRPPQPNEAGPASIGDGVPPSK